MRGPPRGPGGSRFFVPRWGRREMAAHRTGGRSARHVKRLLLADDEPLFREATADLLRRAGYACDTAATAAEVLEALERPGYDVVIADVNMPGNTELELLDALAREAPAVSVVVVTGYPSARAAVRSAHLRAAAYLVKPFHFEELLAAVRVGLLRDGGRAADTTQRR